MTKNGCYNRGEFVTEFFVQDGYNADGTRKMVPIPFINTRDCQYTITTPDTRCEGCSWQKTKE